MRPIAYAALSVLLLRPLPGRAGGFESDWLSASLRFDGAGARSVLEEAPADAGARQEPFEASAVPVPRSRLQRPYSSPRLNALFDAFMEEWLPLNPLAATKLGFHQHSGALNDYSPEAQAKRLEVARRYLRKLEEADPGGLPPEARLDRSLLKADLERIVFTLTDPRFSKHSFDRPQLYLPSEALLMTASMEYAPLEQRFENTLSRLEKLPALLSQGMRQLKNPPKLWTEYAVEDAAGCEELVDELAALLKPAADADPAKAERLRKASREAKAALARFKAFLEKDLLPRSDGDYAIGEEAYDFLLKNQGVPLDSAGLSRLGERDFEALLRKVERDARNIAPSMSWTELAASLKKDGIPLQDILPAARKETDRARRHIVEKGLMTPSPGETLELQETPKAMRSGVATGAYLVPPPLDGSKKGVFLVTPAEGRINRHDLGFIVAHEAYPGHHTQLTKVKDPPLSAIRKVHGIDLVTGDDGRNSNNVFVEGYAVYAEKLMQESGFFKDPKTAWLIDKHIMSVSSNLFLDPSLHGGGSKVEDTVRFQVERRAIPEPVARVSALNSTLYPTQGLGYYLGHKKIVEMRERFRALLGEEFSLKEFNDRLLSYGNISPWLIEAEMEREYLLRRARR